MNAHKMQVPQPFQFSGFVCFVFLYIPIFLSSGQDCLRQNQPTHQATVHHVGKYNNAAKPVRNIYDCYINLPQGIFISDFFKELFLSDCVLFKFTENVSFTELTGVSRTQQNVEDNWIVYFFLFFTCSSFGFVLLKLATVKRGRFRILSSGDKNLG